MKHLIIFVRTHPYFQKQSPGSVVKNIYSKRFRKIHQKAPESEYLFELACR